MPYPLMMPAAAAAELREYVRAGRRARPRGARGVERRAGPRRGDDPRPRALRGRRGARDGRADGGEGQGGARRGRGPAGPEERARCCPAAGTRRRSSPPLPARASWPASRAGRRPRSCRRSEPGRRSCSARTSAAATSASRRRRGGGSSRASSTGPAFAGRWRCRATPSRCVCSSPAASTWPSSSTTRRRRPRRR